MNPADRPPTARRQRPRLGRLQLVASLGLFGSALSFVVGLPHLFHQGGGASTVLGNAAECLWTTLLVVMVISRTRTIGPRAVLGAFFAGFFGLTSLAILAGRPMVSRFGTHSTFAVAVWGPFTEEALKLVPTALFLFFALRNARYRPAVGDAVLFGIAVGSGFSLRENALYGRASYGGPFRHLPFSPALPSVTTHRAGGHTLLVGGHVVYAGLTALGLAITMIYRRRWALARFALPLALTVSVVEHVAANRLSLAAQSGGAVPAWTVLIAVVTIGGYLSSALLVAGITWLAVLEARAISGDRLARGDDGHLVKDALLTRTPVLAGRGMALAQSMRGRT